MGITSEEVFEVDLQVTTAVLELESRTVHMNVAFDRFGISFGYDI